MCRGGFPNSGTMYMMDTETLAFSWGSQVASAQQDHESKGSLVGPHGNRTPMVPATLWHFCPREPQRKRSAAKARDQGQVHSALRSSPEEKPAGARQRKLLRVPSWLSRASPKAELRTPVTPLPVCPYVRSSAKLLPGVSRLASQCPPLGSVRA